MPRNYSLVRSRKDPFQETVQRSTQAADDKYSAFWLCAKAAIPWEGKPCAPLWEAKQIHWWCWKHKHRNIRLPKTCFAPSHKTRRPRGRDFTYKKNRGSDVLKSVWCKNPQDNQKSMLVQINFLHRTWNNCRCKCRNLDGGSHCMQLMKVVPITFKNIN